MGLATQTEVKIPKKGTQKAYAIVGWANPNSSKLGY
jgi:hypothetical protein